ncbi:plasmid pRiA4b ORF-3 family protein [Bacillus mesophilum]|uniref:Plasmid pRiA4b ORF-3 family protein n=1 Tax=Bacillus mesophilum TaxID=1071718 RepID=A0A7V7RLI0_9BACI|nr:plasmid pRiA4b ORF-3 family protein [Bacillus mesophilum]KAB2332625.1 plasmid pRiA4b ORF-3 family protein [Bacillus mesophilum]
MLIQCTKKLLDQLNMKAESGFEEEPLFSWHANLLTINRRKTVVLVNDLTRYTVVLYGLMSKDFKRMDELIIEAISDALHEEGIKEEVIERYINHAHKVTYTKTKDRTHVSRLNKGCEYVQVYSDELETQKISNPKAGKLASMFLVSDGKTDYVYPHEELFKHLETFAGEPIFRLKAVQLKVSLQLEGHNVWRRLVVPLHRTFTDLHEILQAAFGWKDYHLHEFTFYEGGKSGQVTSFPKPVLTLACGEEAYYNPSQHEMKLESGIKLSEYLPDRQFLTYTYDFGDDWKHEIEVEKTIEDYDAPHPICLEGQGNTPPEDVGGTFGYEHFLSILANPNDPDYQHMLQWGREQGYEEFELERVNWLLKRR